MNQSKRKFLKFFFTFLFFLIFKVLRFRSSVANGINYSLKSKIMLDKIFQKFHLSRDHPESPQRITHISDELKQNNLLHKCISFKKNIEVKKWLNTVHTDYHIESLKENYPEGYEVAISGVKSCISAVDKIEKNECKNIFCAIRPPGHHALNTGKVEGFCFFNNIAITAKYLQIKYNYKKILIVDWDYHHGNATQDMFYDDNTVLFFSTHDKYAYPGTGQIDKIGIGKGQGYNINVHLPCGTNDEKIIDVFNNILVPKANKFKPDYILISAGFDSRHGDPLGCFEISDEGFIKLTKIIMSLSKKFCDNKLISILEGGYDLGGNAKATLAHVKTLDNV